MSAVDRGAEAPPGLLLREESEGGGGQWLSRLSVPLLLAPAYLWLGLFFLVPLVIVVFYSFGIGNSAVMVSGTSTFNTDAWTGLLRGSIYPPLLVKSVVTSLSVSMVVVLLAYPVAYFLALIAGRSRMTLLLLVIVPFWTSFLLRVFAWKIILGDQGVVNSLLVMLHVIQPGHPVSWLLYSWFTVGLVLVYAWVPFVALPIFVALENLDRSLLEAAADLGAGQWQAFFRVTLPLSLPGVVAAFLFVFIPTIGEFVTPLLVGGTRGYLYGNAISDLFSQGSDWQTGAVLSLILLALVMVLVMTFVRRLSPRQVVR
jgi:spermidine/putrescine transport system permease protein